MSFLKLTKKQEEGIKIIKERYDRGEKYVTIAGYAGTGKTFMVERAMEALGLSEGEYKMAAFTGKAALVLRQRGFDAVTLHKLLYKSIKIGENFIHKPKKFREDMEGVKVLVIDEISMVPNHILEEAIKHKLFIIALGDPFQLPPIGDDNYLLNSPHIFLDEIVRQGEGSSIVTLSKKIRDFDGTPIEIDGGDEVKVIEREQLVDGMLHWADQILVSKNATRKKINNFMREQLGFSNVLPENGDKIIFTQNNWDLENAAGFAVVNGMIATVDNVKYGRNLGEYGQVFSVDAKVDFSEVPFYDVKIDGNPFKGYKPMVQKQKKKIELEQADFGYAITVHKSQGSEFDKVLLFEERMNRNIDLKALYTAVTRAKEKLVIVKSEYGSKLV